jgi:hypothetical protein
MKYDNPEEAKGPGVVNLQDGQQDVLMIEEDLLEKVQNLDKASDKGVQKVKEVKEKSSSKKADGNDKRIRSSNNDI